MNILFLDLNTDGCYDHVETHITTARTLMTISSSPGEGKGWSMVAFRYVRLGFLLLRQSFLRRRHTSPVYYYPTRKEVRPDSISTNDTPSSFVERR